MKKIVLKCKLSNRDGFEDKLSDIGLDFQPIHWLHDRIYIPRGYKKNSNYPRLVMRTEMEAVDKAPNYYLILKRHIEDSGVDIIETISTQDYEKAVNMILQLGFKLSAEISRQRQSLKMGEGTYIYLDKIENLPEYYAKIESELSEDESVTEAYLDLERTFATLGESNIVSDPYFEIVAS